MHQSGSSPESSFASVATTAATTAAITGRGADKLAAIIGQVTAIVCDWNGTLVDDADRALAATNFTLAAHGLEPLSEHAFRERFTLPLTLFFQTIGLPGGAHDRARLLWNDRLAIGATRLSPGVPGFLAMARSAGVPVGVISAAEATLVRADARALAILDDLAFVSGAAADKASLLQPVVERNAGHVLYLGDTEYDMSEAVKAGALGIAYGSGYQSRASLVVGSAFAVIDHFSELTAALTDAR